MHCSTVMKNQYTAASGNHFLEIGLGLKEIYLYPFYRMAAVAMRERIGSFSRHLVPLRRTVPGVVAGKTSHVVLWTLTWPLPPWSWGPHEPVQGPPGSGFADLPCKVGLISYFQLSVGILVSVCAKWVWSYEFYSAQKDVVRLI